MENTNGKYSILLVKNPFDTDFHFSWDGNLYVIPAGVSLPLTDFLARHAAKKIVTKLMQQEGQLSNIFNNGIRAKYEARVLSDAGFTAQKVQQEVVFNPEGEQVSEVVQANSENSEEEGGFEQLQDVELDEELENDRKMSLTGYEKAKLEEMSRTELQARAKELGIPANQKSEDLITAILNHK